MFVDRSTPRGKPDWDALFNQALAQAGYFTTAQAAEAGFSSALLHKYLRSGKVQRSRRGVYRLVHFPAGEQEDLLVYWLWAEREAVFSHETALALHDLSDSLPSKVHMTLPIHWRRRRLGVPKGLVLHFAALADEERTAYSALPITTPARTLRDCLTAHGAPDVIRGAVAQAARRGLLAPREAAELREELDRQAAPAA